VSHCILSTVVLEGPEGGGGGGKVSKGRGEGAGGAELLLLLLLGRGNGLKVQTGRISELSGIASAGRGVVSAKLEGRWGVR